ATAAGSLEIASPGESRARPTGVAYAEVRALAWDGAGRDLLAAVVDGPGGALVRLKLDLRGKRPLRERFRTALPAPPVALAAAGEAIAVLGGGRLTILAKRGREVGRSVDVAGGFDLVALPGRPASTLPAWSDAPPR
ncbi:MAG TPA: hypothetical protein VLW17_03050, partial [Thermoanaerobaculaceae bacterium]|nr:hypothetical protein [Thermoanaerobaculaceae bacterium]